MDDEQGWLVDESSDSWWVQTIAEQRRVLQERAERLERQRQQILDRLEELERLMAERQP
jgi:hypothetical protein